MKEKFFYSVGLSGGGERLCASCPFVKRTPQYIYSQSKTWETIQEVHRLRQEGVELYVTQDAGPNLKLMFIEKDLPSVLKIFSRLKVIKPFEIWG